jgi:general secretion pathway protein A
MGKRSSFGIVRRAACHAAGNYRTLTTMAAQLLMVAAERKLPQLDEKLYFEIFTPDTRKPARRTGARP